MPLTDKQKQLNEETVNMVGAQVARIKREILITPERMEAFQAAIRIRTNLNINGTTVTLIEDPEAPEVLADAIAKASEAAPQEPCKACGGERVALDDGDIICKKCKVVEVVNVKQQNTILASERAALTKKRRH